MRKTKNKSQAVELLNETIVLPGVRLSRTGLAFEGKPTEEAVAKVGHALQVMQGSSLWWWGDWLTVMTALQKGRKASTKKRDQDKTEQIEMQCITEFAEVTGCALPGQLHERAKVAQFFPASMRLSELTFEHHVEAWLAAGNDQAKALEWLHEAVKGKWKVPQMRAHIRKALSTGDGTQGEPPEQRPDDVDVTFTNMEQLAARRLPKVRGYDQAHARRELGEARNVVAYVEELRSRAAD